MNLERRRRSIQPDSALVLSIRSVPAALAVPYLVARDAAELTNCAASSFSSRGTLAICYMGAHIVTPSHPH